MTHLTLVPFNAFQFRAEPTLNLVLGLIGERTLSLLVGRPNVGKSFVALDLALHVASGRPWRGRSVSQGAVIYFVAEDVRSFALRAFGGADHLELSNDLPFACHPGPIDLLNIHSSDLETIGDQALAFAAQCGVPLRLIVIDCLSPTFGGGDENGRDMGQYVGNLQALRKRAGCAVVVVHHVAKNGESATPRGHGCLEAAADTILAVEGEGRKRKLKIHKQRNGSTELSFTFTLRPRRVGNEGAETLIVEPLDEKTGLDAAAANLAERPAAALEVLRKLLAEVGVVGNGQDAPCDSEAVPFSEWRRSAVAAFGHKAGKSNCNPDSLRKAFDRAAKDLKAKGLCDFNSKWVWLDAGHAGQHPDTR